jgi:hypothetical protein
MTMNSEDHGESDNLETRLRILLPEQYQDCYDDIQPVSMGSAGLKFGNDGNVAWDEIWGSFCDLAMAGGPPHKAHFSNPAVKTKLSDRLIAIERSRTKFVVVLLWLPVSRQNHPPSWDGFAWTVQVSVWPDGLFEPS